LSIGKVGPSRSRFTMAGVDQLLGILRAPETGYGSAPFELACQADAELRWIEGFGPRAIWLRVRRGALLQLCYRLRLPAVTISLTRTARGRLIAEHFAIREHGRPRYRHAQGVLPLPDEFSDYLRGRHRQALRTNLAHARRAGLTVRVVTDPHWTPGSIDSRAPHLSPGPVEHWTALDRDGRPVGNAIVSVDDRVALLHGLVAGERYARWLLHAAIVERLCGRCELLLTNSDAVYRIAPGARHFQQLLGYRIATLRVVVRRRRRRRRRTRLRVRALTPRTSLTEH
jgi:hypothetical protein